MTTYTDAPLILSASTNGRGIEIDTTTAPGTLIHAVTSTSGEIDYIELLACNRHTSLVTLYLLVGGSGNKDIIIVPIEFQDGLKRILHPIGLFGGGEIRAYASVADVVNIFNGSGSTRLTEVV